MIQKKQKKLIQILSVSFLSLLGASLAFAQEEDVVPNPDIQTLVYFPAPEVDPQVLNSVKGNLLRFLYDAATSPRLYLSESLIRNCTIAEEKGELSSCAAGLESVFVADEVGALAKPALFSIVFKANDGVLNKGAHLSALVVISNPQAPGKEYRFVIEAPSVTSQGKSAHDINEALFSTQIMDFKIVQIKEADQSDKLSDLEQLILDAKNDKTYEI
ncbi:MAG: hypothetical protein R3A80_09225 [Bdellovibrionota bacterium]